jgi:hypothetical protein
VIIRRNSTETPKLNQTNIVSVHIKPKQTQ